VQQHHGKVGPHALSEAELAGERFQQFPYIQKFDQHVEIFPVNIIQDPPDDLFPLEALDNRVVPPQFRAVAEQDPKMLHQLCPLFLRRQGQNRYIAAVREQHACKQFHRCAFACAVGSGVSYELTLPDRE